MLNGVAVSKPLDITSKNSSKPYTLICFSHLRFDFVFQRPQHLMNRFARSHAVVVWEEPVDAEGDARPSLHIREAAGSHGVTVITPRLPQGLSNDDRTATLTRLLDGYLSGVAGPIVAWYYTPMMLPFSRHLDPACTVL